MYPNGQSPSPYPPQQTNPYDFLNQQPASTSKVPFNLSSKKAKFIVIGAILSIVFLIFVVISSLFGGGDKEQTQKYINVAKSQTEIIRLATLAEEKSQLTDTKSLGLTTKLTLSTSQRDMTELLGKRGVDQKALSKQLSLSKNSASDQLLEQASQNNRYDEALTALIYQELEDYQKELQSAVSGATKSEFSALDNANTQVSTILADKPKQ